MTERQSEPVDARSVHPGYGEGGVPWYLLLYYLSFLAFFHLVHARVPAAGLPRPGSADGDPGGGRRRAGGTS